MRKEQEGAEGREGEPKEGREGEGRGTAEDKVGIYSRSHERLSVCLALALTISPIVSLSLCLSVVLVCCLLGSGVCA